MCYKDITFCPFVKCAKKCDRKLIKAVKEDAKKAGLPICHYVDKPDCYKDDKK